MLLKIRLTLFAFFASLVTPAVAQEMCTTEIEEVTDLSTYLPTGHNMGDQTLRGNVVEFDVFWRGASGDLDRPIDVHLINVSNEIGMNVNTGDTVDQDFVFDAVLNSPDWVLPDDLTLTYDGVNHRDATTTFDVPMFQEVRIKVSSYDWGGVGEIFAEAVGCTATEPIRFPKDDDDDTLPDAYEDTHFYWGTDRTLRQYSKGATVSPGMPAFVTQDGDSDQDLDLPLFFFGVPVLTPIHIEFGDGLTAYQEYRGVTVQGVSGRTDQHGTHVLPPTGAGLSARGGPDVREMFVYDPDGVFRSDNNFLSSFRIVWHKILQDEMSSDGVKAGVVPFNDPKTAGPDFTPQRAIWVLDQAVSDRQQNFTRDLLGFSDTSVKSGRRVQIDVTDITRLANAIMGAQGAPTFEDILNWVTAHEFGHKLGLEHPLKFRNFVPQIPPMPDDTSLLVVAPFPTRSISFWMPRTVMGNVSQDLAVVIGYEVALVPFTVTNRAAQRQPLRIHGRDHVTQLLTGNVTIAVDPPLGQVGPLALDGHEGHLMDPVIELEVPQPNLDRDDATVLFIKE